MRLKINYEVQEEDFAFIEQMKGEIITKAAKEHFAGMLKYRPFFGRHFIEADFYIITREQFYKLMELIPDESALKAKEILDTEIAELNVPNPYDCIHP